MTSRDNLSGRKFYFVHIAIQKYLPRSFTLIENPAGKTKTGSTQVVCTAWIHSVHRCISVDDMIYVKACERYYKKLMLECIIFAVRQVRGLVASPLRPHSTLLILLF